MNFAEKYLARICNNYNRKHASEFGRKHAEEKYLTPWNLTLKKCPDAIKDDCTLLSKKEEFSLFCSLHFMKYKMLKCPKKLLSRYYGIYAIIRNRAIAANRGLVYKCSYKYSQKNEFKDEDHLMSRGNFGLISAVDAFDPWKGYCFSTYAYPSIWKSLRSKKKRISTSSLDAENDTISIRDTIAKPEYEDENEKLYIERLKKIIDSGILSDKEMDILYYRFGYSGNETVVLHGVGKMWGVSKERVRQVQKKTLAKLREYMEQDSILK